MRIGAYGEVMLRLTPPEYRTLEQTHSLRMDFTGTGVNILGNLAHFNLSASLLTKVPKTVWVMRPKRICELMVSRQNLLVRHTIISAVILLKLVLALAPPM